MAFPSSLLLSALMALSFSIGWAKNAAPAPAVDCSSLVLNMADCLSYVSAGGTATKPEGTCCSGLKTVLKTDAECLCEAFKNSAQLGVTLNMTKALALPSACHVSAPSVSKCGLSEGPGAAPAMSPVAETPTSTIAGAPVAGMGANDLAPAPAPSGGASSDSSALTASIELLALAAFVAASSALF